MSEASAVATLPTATGAALSRPLDGEALMARLPAVRGQIRAHADLSKLTWLRVGGPAEVLFKPADRDDLATFMAGLPSDVPVTVLGTGSNVIIRDGGIPGVVLRLGRPFAQVRFADDGALQVGAGLPDPSLAKVAAQHGRAGLSFFAGIPGTIGGAVRMNAGAFGGETAAVLLDILAIDRTGALHRAGVDALRMGYRRSALPADWIVLEARFHTTAGEPATLQQEIADIQARREATQPTKTPTGGSTFANPDEDAAGGQRAWQLIEGAGCRGLQRGQAQVSDVHCNFLVNLGGATAYDVEALGEDVRRRVKEGFGVHLRWEIARLGMFPQGWTITDGTLADTPRPDTSRAETAPPETAGRPTP